MLKKTRSLLILAVLFVFAVCLAPVPIVAEDSNPANSEYLTQDYNTTDNSTQTQSDNATIITSRLSLVKKADRKHASFREVINYTYIVTNNGTTPVKNLTLVDDKLGSIKLINSENISVNSVLPGEQIKGYAKYRVRMIDVIAGPVKNIATLSGQDEDGTPITVTSNEVEVSTNFVTSLLTKSEILKSSGVPGKGLENAPGLQKPFNEKSQASSNAGKKNKNQNMEQNRNVEQNVTSNKNKEQIKEKEENGNLLRNRWQVQWSENITDSGSPQNKSDLKGNKQKNK